MRPKFEVGEVVLLRSTMFPECNGEYTVLGVHVSPKYEFAYTLDINHHDVEGYSGNWAEQALRKKHQPGDMSFDSLMASLSSPQLLTHQPEGVASL